MAGKDVRYWISPLVEEWGDGVSFQWISLKDYHSDRDSGRTEGLFSHYHAASCVTIA